MGREFLLLEPLASSKQPAYILELQTNLREDYTKFYNHGEGPY